MKIIYHDCYNDTYEEIAHIIGGENLTFDEALELMGEWVGEEDSLDGLEIKIAGKTYSPEDLDVVPDSWGTDVEPLDEDGYKEYLAHGRVQSGR